MDLIRGQGLLSLFPWCLISPMKTQSMLLLFHTYCNLTFPALAESVHAHLRLAACYRTAPCFYGGGRLDKVLLQTHI